MNTRKHNTPPAPFLDRGDEVRERLAFRPVSEKEIAAGRWSDQDTHILRRLNQSGASYAEIAHKLGRSRKAVERKAKYLNLKSQWQAIHNPSGLDRWRASFATAAPSSWSTAALDELRRLLRERIRYAEMETILGRSARAIRREVRRRGWRHGCYYTPDDLKTIFNALKKGSGDLPLAYTLRRSLGGLAVKRRKMGFKRSNHPPKGTTGIGRSPMRKEPNSIPAAEMATAVRLNCVRND